MANITTLSIMIILQGEPVALADVVEALYLAGIASCPGDSTMQAKDKVDALLGPIGSCLCGFGFIQRVFLPGRKPAFLWTYAGPPAGVAA